MMNFFEFWQPILGIDIRVMRMLTTVGFSVSMFLFAWRYGRMRWYWAVAVTALLTVSLQFAPGTVLFLSTGGTGVGILAYRYIASELGWSWKPGKLNYPIERDPLDGLPYGYKWIDKYPSGLYFSPVVNEEWVNGELTALEEPTRFNSSGIYVCWSPDAPELKPYERKGRVLCKVKISGRTIVFSDGARAQHGQIVGEVRKAFQKERSLGYV